jgi:hypothetical protein
MGFINKGQRLELKVRGNLKRSHCKAIVKVHYEGSPSFSSHPIVISFEDKSPSMPLFDSTKCEDMSTQISYKKQKLYEGSLKFQDAWTTCLPWADFVMDDKGLV